MMATANELKVNFTARTGWLQLLVKIAQRIERISPSAALTWLRIMRPVCFIYARFDTPGKPGKWHFIHMPVADGMHVKSNKTAQR